MGSDSDYTIYQVNNEVTIQGAEGAKVFGTFRIESPDVIIKDLEIQNKGNTGTENDDHRSAIKVYAKSVIITNNKITNGMGEEVGLSNAIQIQTEEESSLSDYVIENNEFINNEQPSDKWKSTDILIQEGFGNYKAITASVDDYQSILAKNIFSGDVIKLAHMDYGKTINGTIYLFRSPLGKVTSLNDAIEEAEALTESDYTADTWETLQSALTEAKEVSENIATEDGTYQSTIINVREDLEDAIDGLVGIE